MSQSLSVVYLHAVWSTKERRKYLQAKALRDQMHAFLAGESNTLGCPSIIVGGGDDHVHQLFRLDRSITQAGWVREIKRVSSLWMRQRGQVYSIFSWQSGYGMFSVSPSNVGPVRKYIATQEEHHRITTFQDEFRLLLTHNGQQWDERYIWD